MTKRVHIYFYKDGEQVGPQKMLTNINVPLLGEIIVSDTGPGPSTAEYRVTDIKHELKTGIFKTVVTAEAI